MTTTAGKLPALLAVLASGLFLASHDAMAFPNYSGVWQGEYPASASLDNTSNDCTLCHSTDLQWNAYGSAIQQLSAATPILTRIRAVEGLNSDQDPTGATNLLEIMSDTQPGWSDGPFNTIFDQNGNTSASGQSPPSGFLGLFDPTTGPVCGDGNLDPGEACDDGNNRDGDGCSATCTIEPFCGDGILDPGEQCDDGNDAGGDGCSAACTLEPGPLCGNGLLDPGEQCDDANNTDGDGCSATCTLEPGLLCGNGFLDQGEWCDDGNNTDGDGCAAICTIEVPEPLCGDGVLDAGEQCDDGNNADGDGCAATCTLEPEPLCGDGVLDPGEQCDDANNADGDGCSASCTLEPEPLCGDGILDPGEQCDDGNNLDGDGCSATCTLEAPPMDGAGLYAIWCGFCHGDDGSGGTSREDVRGESPREIVEAIFEEKEMRFLAPLLTDEEIRLIAAFLRRVDDDDDDGDDDDDDDDGDDRDDRDRDEDSGGDHGGFGDSIPIARACGIGFELNFLLPPLMWLGRIRRRQTHEKAWKTPYGELSR